LRDTRTNYEKQGHFRTFDKDDIMWKIYLENCHIIEYNFHFLKYIPACQNPITIDGVLEVFLEKN